MRGHPHALPGGIVVPSVVRANQAAILNTTAGKSSAAMETKIFPRAKAFIASPEDEVLVEKSRRPDFSRSRVRRLSDNVPIVE